MALAKLGQHILLGSRDRDRGIEAVNKIKDAGYDAELIVLDVTSQDDISRAQATVNKKYGHLDILINNAGIALDNHKDAAILSVDVIRKEFDVNFFSVLLA